jgi:hypothetical protein
MNHAQELIMIYAVYMLVGFIMGVAVSHDRIELIILALVGIVSIFTLVYIAFGVKHEN